VEKVWPVQPLLEREKYPSKPQKENYGHCHFTNFDVWCRNMGAHERPVQKVRNLKGEWKEVS